MGGSKIPPPSGRRNSGAILNELAERASRTYNRSLEAWFQCAAILAKAREIAAHGEWLPFLEHAGIPERSARRMIRFARAGVQIGHVADLGGIREADEALALVEAWPDETREWWLDQVGIGGAMQVAINVRTARERWQRAVDDHEDEPETRARIVLALPDGPFSAARWLKYGDALADAFREDDERPPAERLAAMQAASELAPWKRPETDQ